MFLFSVNTIAFCDTPKIIGEGQDPFVRSVSSIIKKVARTAFHGTFESETETRDCHG
jgi:hypothetical protein